MVGVVILGTFVLLIVFRVVIGVMLVDYLCPPTDEPTLQPDDQVAT